jgi:DNA-binding protein HU-beta
LHSVKAKFREFGLYNGAFKGMLPPPHLKRFTLDFQNKRRRMMNKTDLINQVATVVGTQKQAREAVDCVFKSIADALAGSDSVQISGFGSFKVSERKARTGRNPQTGEAIQIPAGRVPRFVAGKTLKDAVK